MVNTLTYVTDKWDGVIWQAPEINRNSKSIIKLSSRDVRVIAVKRINCILWLQIELLNPGRCTLEDPEVIEKGWIPAFSSKGYPNIWFYARGC